MSIPWEAMKNVVNGFPRYKLVHLPTPIQRLKTLSHELGIDLWVKRDDLTGLGMGGNKGRKLEFVIADALAQGAQSIVTWAGVQSNWCLQLSAAARRCGLRPILILFQRPGLPAEIEGNAFLDKIYGAEIHRIELGDRSMMAFESVRDLVETVVERERKAGRTCYVAPIGASTTCGSMTKPLGGIGFLNASVELLEQMGTRSIDVDTLVFATGSGSMQAGLIVGNKLLCPRVKCVGIGVSGSKAEMSAAAETISYQLLAEMPSELRRSSNFGASDVVVFDNYMGNGYGLLNKETVIALRKMAECEGIMLDPVYTGKAFLGLLDLVRTGYIRPREKVVFLHTGGLPALFAYEENILRALTSMEPDVA